MKNRVKCKVGNATKKAVERVRKHDSEDSIDLTQLSITKQYNARATSRFQLRTALKHRGKGGASDNNHARAK